jgi:hypothetical protein
MLTGKSEGKKQYRRPSNRVEDNITINVNGTDSQEVNWVHKA